MKAKELEPTIKIKRKIVQFCQENDIKVEE